MSNPYLLKVNDVFSNIKARTNRSIYLNLGINGAAFTITDFRFSYARIDKGNADNNTISSNISVTAGTFGGAHVDNQGSFAAASGSAGDNLMRLDLPDAVSAAAADHVIINVLHITQDFRASFVLELLHPPILEGIIEERSGGISSSIITLAGSPGLQRYIALYTQFIGTAYEFGKEIIGTTLGLNGLQAPESRVLLPIHGSYYQDGAGNISQINGLAESMGVTASNDLSQAGWAGASLESSFGAGYTFIIPISTGFLIPPSFADLVLLPESNSSLVIPESTGIDLSGYIDGRVWLDQDAGNTNTVLGTDGTFKNPVSSIAALITLADQIGKRVAVKGTFLGQAADFEQYDIIAWGGESKIIGDTTTGVNIVGASIRGMNIGGDCIFTSTTKCIDCTIQSVGNTVANAGLDGEFRRCVIEDDCEVRVGATIKLIDCSGSPDTPSSDPAALLFNGTSGNLNVEVAGYKGTLSLQNMGHASMDVNCYSGGELTLSVGGSNTLGLVTMNGIGNIEGTSGGTTVNTDKWDELPLPIGDATLANQILLLADTSAIQTQTDKMTFTVANQIDSNIKYINDNASSAAKAQKASLATYSGIIGAGTNTTLAIIATDLTGFATDAFKGKSFNLITNSAEGAGAVILTYNTATGAFTFNPNFPLPVVPTVGAEFVIS